MHSLDIRRGLGVAAVAALVITGLPPLSGTAYAAAAEVGSVRITPPETETKRPGQSTDTFGVTVLAPDGSPVAGETVTLSVDSGYFTPLANRPEVPEDLGETVTVTTDENGIASFKIAIGRDTGFDDDGQVVSTITATAGGVSDTEDQVFLASDPVNGSAVDLVRFDTGSGSAARFDVLAYDEFGNPVAGEVVSLGDTSSTVTTPATAESVLQPAGTVEVVATGGERERTRITASWVSSTRESTTPVTFTDAERVRLDDRPVPQIELEARDNGARTDRLFVDGTRVIAGDVVQVLRLRPGGKKATVAAQGRANRRGDVRLDVPDANGRRRTTFVAVVAGSPDHAPAGSDPVRVR